MKQYHYKCSVRTGIKKELVLLQNQSVLASADVQPILWVANKTSKQKRLLCTYVSQDSTYDLCCPNYAYQAN